MHHGVYVDHTGPLTWPQRAWAAVLYAAPAALCLESALRAAELPGRYPRDEQVPIQVAVSPRRATLTEPQGVRIYRLAHLEDRVLWNVGPPRLKYDEAALDVACRAASELDAIAVLANACQSRRTTARRLLESLDCRQRIRGRRWLRADPARHRRWHLRLVPCGEHGNLDRVERPHGLPTRPPDNEAVRLVGGCVYRDAEYAGRLVVELDGRHVSDDSASARDADIESGMPGLLSTDGRTVTALLRPGCRPSMVRKPPRSLAYCKAAAIVGCRRSAAGRRARLTWLGRDLPERGELEASRQSDGLRCPNPWWPVDEPRLSSSVD